MRLAWRGSVIVAGVLAAVSLGGCVPAPVPSGSASPSASTSSTYPPGPKLTAGQFENFVKSGKVGDRTVKLALFEKATASDPDNEESENQAQSKATTCVKMNKLADAGVVAQAADDDAGVVVQLFDSLEVVTEVFALNQLCAAEEAKLDAGSAVTGLESGTVESASWWLLKDPEGGFQVAIAYGNVLAFVLVDNADRPTALVTAFAAQLDQLAKG